MHRQVQAGLCRAAAAISPVFSSGFRLRREGPRQIMIERAPRERRVSPFANQPTIQRRMNERGKQFDEFSNTKTQGIPVEGVSGTCILLQRLGTCFSNRSRGGEGCACTRPPVFDLQRERHININCQVDTDNYMCHACRAYSLSRRCCCCVIGPTPALHLQWRIHPST